MLNEGRGATTSYRLQDFPHTIDSYTLLASLIQDWCHAHGTRALVYMLLHHWKRISSKCWLGHLIGTQDNVHCLLHCSSTHPYHHTINHLDHQVCLHLATTKTTRTLSHKTSDDCRFEFNRMLSSCSGEYNRFDFELSRS